ncbi:MAG: glycerophosphodiester phosphodiesterase [Bacilli bacterium]
MKKNKYKSLTHPLILQGICHRGLHNQVDTENGINAFKNALNASMAIELDVHLTKDNELVVFHDSSTLRITKKEGIIEDLTLEEIKNNYRLADNETIPTLKEVLELVNEQVPIVLELKVFRKNYVLLSKRVKEELKIIKDKRNITIISFDPRALVRFKKEGYLRLLLVTEEKKYRWIYHLRHLFEGVDLEYSFLKQKKVQRYCKNHFVNVWTVDNKEVFDKCLPYVDTITFQHMDEQYVKTELSKKNKI